MSFEKSRSRAFALWIVALTFFATSLAQAASVDPLAAANSFLDANGGNFGLSAADLAARRPSDNYVTSLNGVAHVYFIQQVGGIDVFNAIFSVAVKPSGEVVAPANNFVSNLAGKVNTTTPVLTAEAAVIAAAQSLGISATAPLAIESSAGGPTRAVTYAPNGISLSSIPVKLMLFPTANAVRLTWDVTLAESRDHIWMMKVDAVNGAVLHKMDMVQSDSYSVYAWPAESPNHVTGKPLPPADGRTIVTEAAADAVASPYGWHDDDGAPGADTTDTTGNNVVAQTDLALVPGQTATTDDEYTPVIDTRPSSPTRDFVYPVDLTQNPEAYKEAVVTNLFYWNNVVHDIMFRYGFDEAAGNFQNTNYSGAGEEGDAVIADAMDGSGTNNANFATPTDGSAPRMQMYIWLPTRGNEVVVNSPAGLGTYEASGATWGRRLDATGVTGDVVLANDGAANTWDLCEPMPLNSLTGKIVLAERGTCNFTVKAQNAERAGAAGIIIVNNQGDNETLTMGGATPETDQLILVPGQMIGRRDGLELKANLPANVTMRDTGGAIPRRDSDFDNGVIIHEYGHGISTRLTGGPSVNSCLSTPQQGGEGWSDWFALVLTAQPHHTATTPRGIGTYLEYEDNVATARGIRPYPYTTDKSVNPQTYADLTTGKLSVPHGVGSVWATTLWDMYWAIVGGVPELGLPALGFRQNLYDLTEPLAGNQVALRLVLDGLKLQECDPSFLEARDAILEADRLNFGGRFACYIWWAFARRGMGVNANDDNDGLDVTADFSMPQACTGGACLISPKFDGAKSVISATNGTTMLTVRWDPAVPNCGTSATYSVFRSTENNFVPGSENLIVQGVSGASYDDRNVSPGVRYFYVVRATDSLGNSEANTRRRSGVPMGELVSGATFFDDAGDTVPQQFLPHSTNGSWSVRGTGGVLESKVYATSASGNYPSLACMKLESDTMYLGADPDLQFFTSWQIEPTWDGGIVEVATEDGNFSDWTKLETIQYPGVMAGPQGDPACSNPGLVDGQRAFNGASPTLVPFLGSLAEYANQAVRVRFVFTSDSGTELGGWLVDNISVDDVRASGPQLCFDDGSQRIAYSSGWHEVKYDAASDGTFRMHAGSSPSHGVAFQFDVETSPGKIAFSYAKSAKGGKADVYVDGVHKGTIDFKGTAKDSRKPEMGFTFTVEGLAAGAHTFELRNLSGVVYVDRFCVTNGNSSALPVNVPGVTTTQTANLAIGQETLQTLTMPAGAKQLSVMAEASQGLPVKLVVLNSLGTIVGAGDSSAGFTVVDVPVTAGSTYIVKTVNLAAGPVSVWTASTPLLQR